MITEFCPNMITTESWDTDAVLTGHYMCGNRAVCDSLVNYVTPAHTAAGGTGSVSPAESAKLSMELSCVSLDEWLSHSQNQPNTKALKQDSALIRFKFHSRVIVGFPLKHESVHRVVEENKQRPTQEDRVNSTDKQTHLESSFAAHKTKHLLFLYRLCLWIYIFFNFNNKYRCFFY